MKKRKNNNLNQKQQKGFYFEDYAEVDNFNKGDINSSKISLDRIVFVFFFFVCLIFIFSMKAFYISFSKDDVFNSNIKKYKPIKTRADILDRNGVILARSIDVHSVAIKPQLVRDEKKLLLDLKRIIPELDLNKIKTKLKKNNFFYVKKRITEDEKIELWLLSNQAIKLPKKQFRLYPQKNLFSHVIGQIDEDNNGISGTEKYFDKNLKSGKTINSSLTLTLDSNLQYLIREELIKAQEIFKTIGSGAILMNVDTGEILSLISLPDYDLNKRSSINENIYTNKITKGVYELGSVFKTFTLAAGLEYGVITSSTIFKNLENKIFCAGNSISEHDKLSKNLSAEQILIQSSNIGAVKIAQKIGLEKFKNFLDSLELFSPIDFELEEIGYPLKFRWGKCKLATASFGHGITTTPLQLARAYAILGNGGYKIKPTILKNKQNIPIKESVVSSETSRSINSMLRKVVHLDEGTANFADIQGYEVGGKTGTALKTINGVYSNKKFNTFVSLFPTSRPKYVLLVILDEPKPSPDLIYVTNGKKKKGQARNESGWNTVYVAGKIIEKIGPILAIKNLQASTNF